VVGSIVQDFLCICVYTEDSLNIAMLI